MKVCAAHPCPNLVESGLCPAHKQVRGQEIRASRLSRGHRFYSLARWRHPVWGLRARVLREEPFCRVVGCKHITEEADHIIPHRGSEELFFKRENVQGLCRTHHAEKTARGE